MTYAYVVTAELEFEGSELISVHTSLAKAKMAGTAVALQRRRGTRKPPPWHRESGGRWTREIAPQGRYLAVVTRMELD